jgi:hypothetical protein
MQRRFCGSARSENEAELVCAFNELPLAGPIAD